MKKEEAQSQLLSFINNRLSVAKKWTEENYIEQAKRAQDDYDRKPTEGMYIRSDSVFMEKRYQYVVPIVFNNVETFKAATFDQQINIIFKGRGKDDDQKAKIVEASYEYLRQLLRLDDFFIEAAHNFFLTGYVNSHVSFKDEVQEVPVYNETGEPLRDETGATAVRLIYTYNDPVIDLGDPEEVYFSPDSEPSVDGTKIPYYFRKILMLPREIKKVYGTKVEPDHKISLDESSDNSESERCEVFMYYGDVPKKYRQEVKEYREDSKCLVVVTKSKLLYASSTDNESRITTQKLFSSKPKKFFGYGLGETLRQFQKERSIRRSQMIHLGDLNGFPKWFVKNDGENDIDFNALQDPTDVNPVQYHTTPPTLSQPPTINPTILDIDSRTSDEAQQTSGLIDLSTGGQQSIVKTATGQSIFAEASERKVRFAKNKLASFKKENVIKLLKLCQQGWREDKVVQITDENQNTVDVTITQQSLEGIDFDKDIDIEVETPALNKDLMRAQNIDLYGKMKDNPNVDQVELIKFLFKEGYGKDGSRFIQQSDLQPGMTLMGQDGKSYIVDESGKVVPNEQPNEQMPGSPAPMPEPAPGANNEPAPSNVGNYLGQNL